MKEKGNTTSISPKIFNEMEMIIPLNKEKTGEGLTFTLSTNSHLSY